MGQFSPEGGSNVFWGIYLWFRQSHPTFTRCVCRKNFPVGLLKRRLAVGDYTMIVSAFEPQHMGPFTLKLECSHHFELETVPQEGAGMYHKVIRGHWYVSFNTRIWVPLNPTWNPQRDSQTAAGGPNFKRYMYNPIYEVELRSVTQVKYAFFCRCSCILCPHKSKNATSAPSTIFAYFPQCHAVSSLLRLEINRQAYYYVWPVLGCHIRCYHTTSYLESREVSYHTVNISPCGHLCVQVSRLFLDGWSGYYNAEASGLTERRDGMRNNTFLDCCCTRIPLSQLWAHGISYYIEETTGETMVRLNEAGVNRNSFTRLSVARDGFACGQLVMIHWRRVFMVDLLAVTVLVAE